MVRFALILALLFPMLPCAEGQWQLQQSPTTADLRGIDNVGNGIAWASGTNGTILRTTNSGVHWQRCTTPPDAEHLDFRGIQAFGATTAIAMSSGPGDQSRLYKTTDACQTWTLLFTNPDKTGFWDSLQFDDRNQNSFYSKQNANGVLLGDPVNGIFTIFVTRNAGDTWTRWNQTDPKHLPRAQSGELIFAASNQAVVSPGSNGPFAFVTGGKNSRIYLSQPHSPFDAAYWYALSYKTLGFGSGDSAGAFALAARRHPNSPFADFMIVGGDYKQQDRLGSAAFVPTLSNPFSKRVIVATTPPHGYRSAVAYDAPTKTWITIGPNGTDISTDDGHNWRALTPTKDEPADADKSWNALSLPYVVGPHGRIGKFSPEVPVP